MAKPDRQPEDTGRQGYLEADEAWDGSGRPRVYIPEPYFATASEELEYEHAVEETRGLIPSERMEAIQRRFAGGEVVKRMPRARQSRRERDRELAKLREQAEEPEEWWQR